MLRFALGTALLLWGAAVTPAMAQIDIAESHFIDLGDQVLTNGGQLNIKQLLRAEGARLRQKELARVIVIAKSRNGNARIRIANNNDETRSINIGGIPGDFNSPMPDTYDRKIIRLDGYSSDLRWLLKVKRGRIKFKAIVAELKPERVRLESLDFGGMYGMGWNGSGHFNYPNPLTGSNSCPRGYTAGKALGSNNLDYPVFFCYRQKQRGRPSLADFGGMFGGGQNGPYVNAATGSSSCPAGYRATQILGTHGRDYPLSFCWRRHREGRAPFYPFAGLSGGFWAGYNGIYPNPITGTASCPQGYELKRTLGTYAIDYNVDYCVPR